MAKDALLTLSKALPNASANNATGVLDINVHLRATSAGGSDSNQWLQGYFDVKVPALADHTNANVSVLLTLQDSADNSSYANTSPMVQIAIPGVASTGSAAALKNLSLPPSVQRFIRFRQDVPANGGTGSNASVIYELVV